MSPAAKPQGGSSLGETAEPMVMRVRSPDLSRMLSISSIVVALVVAGALALEGVIGRSQLSSITKAEDVVEAPPAPHGNTVRADQKRVQYLEQRLALLERQIVVLQTQVSSEQKQSSALTVKVTSLESAITEAEDPRVEQVNLANAPDPVRDPGLPEVKPAEDVADDGVVIVPAADTVIATSTAVPDAEETAAMQPDAETPDAETPDVETIATGSIDPKKAVTPVAAANRNLSDLVKPAVRNTAPTAISRTRFGVALDLYKSIDDVKTAWKILKRAHGPVIGEFEPRALPQGTQEGELVYRLMVGPIENVADAARRCARLERHGVQCKAAVYSGEPLNTPPAPGTLIKVEVVADDGVEPPLQPLPDPKFAALPAKIRKLVANAPLPRPKPKPSS